MKTECCGAWHLGKEQGSMESSTSVQVSVQRWQRILQRSNTSLDLGSWPASWDGWAIGRNRITWRRSRMGSADTEWLDNHNLKIDHSCYLALELDLEPENPELSGQRTITWPTRDVAHNEKSRLDRQKRFAQFGFGERLIATFEFSWWWVWGRIVARIKRAQQQ